MTGDTIGDATLTHDVMSETKWQDPFALADDPAPVPAPEPEPEPEMQAEVSNVDETREAIDLLRGELLKTARNADVEWLTDQIEGGDADGNPPSSKDFTSEKDFVAAIKAHTIAENERRQAGVEVAKYVADVFSKARAVESKVPKIKNAMNLFEQAPEVFAEVMRSEHAPLLVALFTSRKDIMDDIIGKPVAHGMKAIARMEMTIEDFERKKPIAKVGMPEKKNKNARSGIDYSTKISGSQDQRSEDVLVNSDTDHDMVEWQKFRNQTR